MHRIAALGPAGTFSDLAAQRYVETQKEACEVVYFSSIKLAMEAVGNDCDLGILPIENFSEGYVSMVLDQLAVTDLCIIDEIMQPVQFSFVSNLQNMDDLEQLFVQFVAKGQCSEFIESLGDIEVYAAESNIASLNAMLDSESASGAIVPAHAASRQAFNIVVENVNDYKNNQTRFLVVEKQSEAKEIVPGIKYKTSLIVFDDNDHPGMLGEVLTSFAKRNINLTSLISRPSRQTFGRYHFFIDIDGHVLDPRVKEALEEIASMNRVRALGSYPRAGVI